MSPNIPMPIKHVLVFETYDWFDINKKYYVLNAPKEVWDFIFNDASKPEDKRICNGCGTASTAFIPDTMWGLNISVVCNIHDASRTLARDQKEVDEGDLLFLKNLIAFIDAHSNFIMRFLRRRRALKYYEAVKETQKIFHKY